MRTILTCLTIAAVMPTNPPPLPSVTDVIATCLVLEAGGEKKADIAMRAVMEVIINRADNNHTAHYTEVLRPHQFSSMKGDLEELINKARKHVKFEQALIIVRDKRCGQWLTMGATHFHRKGFAPKWSKTLTPTAVIGNHIFYK